MAVTAVALLIGACGSSDDGGASSTAAPAGTGVSTAATATATTAGGKPVNVAFLVYTYADFHQAQKDGIESVVSKDGGRVQVFSANFDPQKQLKQCQDAVSSGRFDAIILEAVEGPTGVPCVAAAKQADIPVVALDIAVGKDPEKIEPQTDGVVASIVQTPTANAKNLVDITKEACKGVDPCKVIAEVATPSDHFTNLGVDTVAKEAGPNVQIEQKVVGQYDPSVIAKAFPDALSAHPDATVFLSAADTQALAVVPAVKQAGKQDEVKLLGNGGSRLGIKGVEDGTLFATAGNWPFQEAVAAAKAATQAVNGETVDPTGVDALAIDEPRIITKANVAEFTPEWGAE
ncbi:sugar ABC transporter substrate-binding protein [Capillimicrobium parvum]|nr:sugar ABC transporter substrate-binding protein [Capillimicrobium parvum]